MKPLFFCPLWGQEESGIEPFCARVAEAGYDGIEICLPVLDNAYRDRVLAVLDQYGLRWIAQNAQFYNDAEDPVEKLRRNGTVRSKPIWRGGIALLPLIGKKEHRPVLLRNSARSHIFRPHRRL